ncbi:hypothetical protein BDQ17DRAFT_1357616 [Cyathus striatus]|nr:hypothetical protein BDQ17DRAFT_1357616 [Cyathus striatus]
MFLELLGHETVLGKVWFETARVSLHFALELGAAIGLTVVSHPRLCFNNRFSVTFLDILPTSLCASTKVLQAFAWICTLSLTCYLLLLVTSIIIRRKQDQTIWHCSMSRFPWAEVLRPAENAATISTHKFQEIITSKVAPVTVAKPNIEAPIPRRALGFGNTEEINSRWPAPGMEYEFEHHASLHGNALQLDVQPPPAMFPWRERHLKTKTYRH